MKARLVRTLLLLIASGLLGACANKGYSVIASTATTIGVSLAAQPASGAPDATLGYKRAELAFVPTNRKGGPEPGNHSRGARDSANVIMELRYTGMFATSEKSGIYQRLAVGDIAVKQTGAALMLARDAEGKLDQEAVKAAAAIKTVQVVNPQALAARAPFDDAYMKSKSDEAMRKKYDSAVSSGDCGSYADYEQFMGDAFVSEAVVRCVRDKLNALQVGPGGAK